MSKVKLMDCTLRDGGNVMGKGFDAEITDMVLDGLTACGVPIIEFGNAGGIGAYEVAGFTQALTDQEYLDIGKKYLGRGSELGMFLNARRYREKNVDIAKENGLSFLRIGADAGDGDIALTQIADIKKRGMKAYYSLMKAYILSPQELAEEAKKLEAAGLDEVTIMDSAGTMSRPPYMWRRSRRPSPSRWHFTATITWACPPPTRWRRCWAKLPPMRWNCWMPTKNPPKMAKVTTKSTTKVTCAGLPKP